MFARANSSERYSFWIVLLSRTVLFSSVLYLSQITFGTLSLKPVSSEPHYDTTDILLSKSIPLIVLVLVVTLFSLFFKCCNFKAGAYLLSVGLFALFLQQSISVLRSFVETSDNVNLRSSQNYCRYMKIKGDDIFEPHQIRMCQTALFSGCANSLFLLFSLICSWKIIQSLATETPLVEHVQITRTLVSPSQFVTSRVSPSPSLVQRQFSNTSTRHYSLPRTRLSSVHDEELVESTPHVPYALPLSRKSTRRAGYENSLNF